MQWILDNKEWVFSGFGIAVILFICNIFFFNKKNGNKTTQNQYSGDNSVNLQSKRDINIKNFRDKK